MGMDYGGVGVRGTFLPIQKLGFFAGIGYNLDEVGFNTGVQMLLPKRRHAFYFTGMYGYNGVLIVTGELEGKGTYYGFSVGAGYQLKVGRNKNFWNWEILVPFRNRNFYNDYDTLKNLRQNPGDILPVTLSVGYHIQIRP